MEVAECADGDVYNAEEKEDFENETIAECHSDVSGREKKRNLKEQDTVDIIQRGRQELK